MKIQNKTAFARAMKALCRGLQEIRENEGKEGFQKDYDKALHLWCNLKIEGLRVVRVKSELQPEQAPPGWGGNPTRADILG